MSPEAQSKQTKIKVSYKVKAATACSLGQIRLLRSRPLQDMEPSMHDPPNISSATASHKVLSIYHQDPQKPRTTQRVRPPPDNHGPLNCFVSIREKRPRHVCGNCQCRLPHQNQKNLLANKLNWMSTDRRSLYLYLHYTVHTVCIFYAYPYVIVSWTLKRWMISLAAAHILVWT